MELVRNVGSIPGIHLISVQSSCEAEKKALQWRTPLQCASKKTVCKGLLLVAVDFFVQDPVPE